jgi:hypothetical protein
MNDRAILISIPNVAWQTYLNTSSEWLGRSVSKSVDSSGSQLADLAKYTASLAELTAEDSNARQALRERGPCLRHTFYSFLISTSPSIILNVAENTDLNVLSHKGRVAVVSGTLDLWVNAIVTCCRPNNKLRLKELFNGIKLIFDQLGLQDVFFEFNLRSHTDGTFYLELK